ncbi:flagellar biosynthetic protein FliO [Cellulomonas sp. NPDC058312]|uniref:flagellar biosynthetic protein FliO n=1 Tax=Cellulomonas sp. NPDC058312 TaxID=3346441 RepID=UPI0036E442F0
MDTAVLGLRVLLALACVVGLIWVLARRAGWGKGRRRPAGPAVEVVGRQALGRHAGVAVIAVGNRRLLLGYGEQNVTMLTELAPAPAEMPASLADATPAGPPMTLGALAAAVLPTPRGPRTPRTPRAARATRSAVPAGDAFAEVLADAERAVPVTPATPEAAAASATAAASASAAAALAAAAAIPVDPARPDAARVEHVAEPVGAGALHGSVLAPSTWKQAVAVLRERTVRR